MGPPGQSISHYLTIVENTLLTAEFRARISERERQRDFPFSIHNIYRVLLAAEPVLLDSWLAVAGRQQLSEHDRRLGTSLRCLRYLHVLLVAARHAGYVASALEPIARRALGMLRCPSCFCRSHLPLPGPEAHIPPDLGLRLAATLRQLADVRWLGQHDQGFIGWPPRLSGEARVVVYSRCFGNLPAELGLRAVAITVAYDLPSAEGLAFDLFRGELVAPPPRESVLWCALIDGNTQRPLAVTRCQQLLTDARNAVRRARLALPAAEAEGNLMLADIFMRELLAAAGEQGIVGDGWRRSVRDRLAMPLPFQAGTMTDAYLDRLTEAVAGWRAHLALATDRALR
jgi:hypothetical protein